MPLAPSWVIGEKTRAAAKLVPDSKHQRYEIDIHTGVSDEEIQDARKKNSTVKNSRLECPHCKQSTPIEVIRRHLRLWENNDLHPGPTMCPGATLLHPLVSADLERLLCLEQVLQANLSGDYGGWTLGKVGVAIDSLLPVYYE